MVHLSMKRRYTRDLDNTESVNLVHDTGNDTSGEKEFNLSHHTWEDYRDTHF